MNVVQILMNCVEDVSSIRIFMPKDLRPAVNRNTVKKTVDEVLKRYEGNVPCLDPIEDMKVSVFLFFSFCVLFLFCFLFLCVIPFLFSLSVCYSFSVFLFMLFFSVMSFPPIFILSKRNALTTEQIKDETFNKMLENCAKVKDRLNSLHFDLSDPKNAEMYAQYEKKMELTEIMTNKKKEIEAAKTLVLTVFFLHFSHAQDTLQKMKRVLRRLGYIDDADVVQTKGRVACEINSADELLLTELIYDGTFLELTPQQCVALLASVVFLEKVGA